MPEVHAVPSRMPSRAPLRVAVWTCALVAVLVATLLTAAGVARADDPAAGGAVATASSLTVLKRGSRGPEVRRVQRRLRIQADGIFGRGTARAVRRFQRRKGLTADGVVGPITARALGITLARETRRQAAAAAPADVEATLRKIALCESGGDPRAVSPDGQYRGKYQFSRPTWEGLGGKGDPAKAAEAEQDRLARKLYEQRGTAPWPNCA